ncbi:MAG: DUF6531 domain-containing protein [Verrucomicrobiae bacterium]|nr:DUF6531 domain-containing protein [Verrucomicrobiae bacterium]
MPPYCPFVRFLERSIFFKTIQLFVVALVSVWILIPQQVWACGSCSEVAINSTMGVDHTDGKLTLSQTDFSLPGFAGAALVRNYSSGNDTFGPFGYGWTIDGLNVLLTTTGDIKVNFGKNSETFKAADGYVNSDRSKQLAFIGSGDGQKIEITNRTNEKWLFDVNTRACTRYQDRNGNATQYEMIITNKHIYSLGNGTNAAALLVLPTKITHADGRQTLFSYTSNLCTQVSAPDGTVLNYAYVDGLLTGVSQNDGQILNYDYEIMTDEVKTRGWLRKVSYANGAEINVGYNGEFGSTNIPLRVTEVTGPLGYVHNYGYQPGANKDMTTIQTDSRGGKKVYVALNDGAFRSVTNALGFGSASHQDSQFRTVRTVNARGFSTWNAYDVANTNVLSQNNLLAETNALGKVWQYRYNDQNQRIMVVDPLSHTNRFGYDSRGNLVTVTNALNREVTCLEYTTNGLISASIDARGNTNRFYRNEWGMVTNRMDALGRSWLTEYNGAGYPARSVDPLGNSSSVAYNNNNKPVAVTNALGQVTRFEYSDMSDLTKVTDANNNSVHFTYDLLQRRTSIKNAMNNETRFVFDAESNLTTLTNALNQVYTYTFDAANQTKTFTYPDNSKETYNLDPNGNLIAVTNRAGQVIKATYDAGDRLNKRTYVQAGDDVVFDYDFDAANRLVRATRLLGANAQWAVTNKYDRADRLTHQQQGPYGVGFSYDLNSNEKKLVYPSGLEIKYLHNRNNALSQIQSGTNGVMLAKYARDAAGQVTKRTQANGVETICRHNAAGYVTNMVVRSTAGGTTNVLMRMTYGFDNVGNRLWVKNKNGRGDVYQYNANYEVTGVKYNVKNPADGYAAATNPSRTVIYNLDAVGNRTSVTDNGTNTLYTINNLNQYTAVGSQNLSYDGKGNLTGDGTWTFSYDHDNNLVGASKTGATATYQRDALGRRISKTVNGVTITYIYAGDDLIEERNADGTVKAQYIYEAGIDWPVKAVIGGVDYYFSQDILGNVIALTDASGNLVEQYWYDIYGKPTIKDGSYQTLTTAKTPFLFTGREYDSETGLYHYRARAYSPDLGRFLQADPISFDGGDINLYRYCANDPINYKDPEGLEKNPACVLNCEKQLSACFSLGNIAAYGTSGGLAGLGAQGVNKTAPKPRGGVAGGGPSGRYTSWTRTAFGDAGKAAGRTSMRGAAAIGAGAGMAALHAKCWAEYYGCLSGCPDECP